MAGEENASGIMLRWRHRRIIHLNYPDVHPWFILGYHSQKFVVPVSALMDDFDWGGGWLYNGHKGIRTALMNMHRRDGSSSSLTVVHSPHFIERCPESVATCSPLQAAMSVFGVAFIPPLQEMEITYGT